MLTHTFEFSKIEKYKLYLDFNPLHDKIKEDLIEHFKNTSEDWDNNDWDKYTWVDAIMEAFTNNQIPYLFEVYDINVNIQLQENIDEIDSLTMDFQEFLEELYNITY